jgi:hypothetical protein
MIIPMIQELPRKPSQKIQGLNLCGFVLPPPRLHRVGRLTSTDVTAIRAVGIAQ